MIRELSYLVSLLCNLVAATNPDTTDIIRYQSGHVLLPTCVISCGRAMERVTFLDNSSTQSLNTGTNDFLNCEID